MSFAKNPVIFSVGFLFSLPLDFLQVNIYKFENRIYNNLMAAVLSDTVSSNDKDKDGDAASTRRRRPSRWPQRIRFGDCVKNRASAKSR